MRIGRFLVVLAAGVVVTPYAMQALEPQHTDQTHPHHIVANADALIPTATELPRLGWEATASSEETAGENGRATNVLDGDPNTFWHSTWTTPTPLPQSITVDMRATQRVSGLVYTPRPGGGNGTIGRYEIRLSQDGTAWGNPVSTGIAADDPTAKTFSFAVSGARFVRLTALTEAGGRGDWASAAELGVLGDPGPPTPAVPLPRTGWTATASDQEAALSDGRAVNVLDGNPNTFWHSRYDVLANLPHSITLDLGKPTVVSGLTYRPRPAATGGNGRVGEYRIAASTDGTTFGAPVASGRWVDDAAVKHALFAGPVTTRYLRLTALTEAGDRGQWSSAAELELVGPPARVDPPLSRVGWVATASSAEAGFPASALVDNRLGTYWRSAGTGAAPHSVTVDLQREQRLSAVVLTPRAESADGRIGQYSISLSSNGSTFGAPVAQGTWVDDGTPKTAVFTGTARYVRVTSTSEAGNRVPWHAAAEFNAYGPSAVPGPVAPLDRTGWVATASDEETASENGRASNVLDGNDRTIWHSKYSAPTAPLPHWITLDMRANRNVAGVSVRPRGDGGNGNIGQYRVHISADGVNWGSPVAEGVWPDSSNVQTALLDSAVSARYVRITALTEAGGRGPWSTASEITVLTPSTAPDASSVGSWGSVIGFPLVPVASALLPNNKLLTWSAYAPDTFGGSNGYTQTAIYDLTTGQVTQRRIDNTGHDMFCPGTSTLPDGRVLVTGGSNAEKASIYNPFTDSWSAAPPMRIARGYQGQTTLSTGEAFTVGGSWSGNQGGKAGEVYSPATNSWRTLSGVPADPFVTADPAGVYRADNHAWLFAASGGRVFHAGPSKRMHWVSTTGNGAVTDAGLRGDSPDAMNGNAVMYDVGKILTVGGATAYQDADATTRAYTVDIATTPPTVRRVGDMARGRAFANSVVLPDGSVVVIGGQERPVPFSDQTAVLTAELWNPSTGTFRPLAPVAVPRTYHSVANLLPDGRVFSGGGGLCGNCATNHFDGQILTPPNLLNADGSPKSRPVITAAPPTAANGTTITVNTDRPVTRFALIRTSSVTHSVDNDQRRIPVIPVQVNATTYRLTVPADKGVALPGHYLLFALDGANVHSTALTIRIG
ncbi:discoidin domain-containing protein [Actinokineospora auranticolor]|uniref:Galactose oxidase n=1 Tax=Actinokineospora auranticolor TaxID=155976 RepID=A0A2S6GTB3_9PSEU|nr:discoidin domain-containing protein [Actinokineospora auranticolor]PPK68436.1 galactose oxidase [Actinokineospora auranticolor]